VYPVDGKKEEKRGRAKNNCDQLMCARGVGKKQHALGIEKKGV
jgi:hypothetical protein